MTAFCSIFFSSRLSARSGLFPRDIFFAVARSSFFLIRFDNRPPRQALLPETIWSRGAPTATPPPHKPCLRLRENRCRPPAILCPRPWTSPFHTSAPPKCLRTFPYRRVFAYLLLWFFFFFLPKNSPTLARKPPPPHAP